MPISKQSQTMEMQITKELKDYIVSFRGTVGNPEGPFWFCGIEFGDGGVPSDLSPLESPVTGKEGSYNRIAGKIVWASANKNLNNIDAQFKEHLFSKSGCVFKINLYPLPFKSSKPEYWSKEHYKKTGISCKVIYQALCIQHRFPYLRKLVENYKPKVLLCTSQQDSWAFKLAFLGEERYFEEKIEEIELRSNEEKIFKVSCFLIGETSVFITNFLGGWGIKSNDECNELGKLIRHKTDINETLIKLWEKA